MPKYPFTPELLEALPEELAEQYRRLEETLLLGICSRLKAVGTLNEVTVQHIRALRAHGISLDEIRKAIAAASGESERTLDAMLKDVVSRNQAYYTGMIRLAQVAAPETFLGHADIWAVYRQTRGELRNLTQSAGFLVTQGRRRILLPPARAYQWALDQAALQIQSGAVSYRDAIAKAIGQLAESGLKTVSYEGGHVDSLDAAVRRAVTTGVNQINQQYREQSMDYLGTDLVEVTAHSGARDKDGPNGWENHKKWQGKVYRWAEKPRTSKGRYPDFAETCGYGSVTGIGGANCRHSYWPFLEGVSERTYTDAELAGIDPPPFTFEGRTYTAYEATQKQRQIERAIRAQKRLCAAYKAAGLTEEASAAGARLRALNAKYRAFSRAAGLPEQRERMRVSYVDESSKMRASALRIRRDAETPIREAIRRGDYPLTINPEKQARHMAETAMPGRSVITISQEELQEIINKKAGRGKLDLTEDLAWKNREIVDAEREIGYTVNRDGDIIKAYSIKIHYSKTGVHAVPFSGR